MRLAFLCVFLLACRSAPEKRAAAPAPTSDIAWLVAAEPSRDAVHASDTEADLVKRFGAANVRRDSINVGEGFYEPGAVVFPRDPARRFEVMWADTVKRSSPSSVHISGRSRWVVFPGVTLGTCLDAIERLNGGPFTLFGFAFDGSGMVNSWNGGRLDTLWGASPYPAQRLVAARFEPTKTGPLGREVEGDRTISSTHPAMRAAAPCISDFYIRPR